MELDRTRSTPHAADAPAAHPVFIEWSRWSRCDTSFSLVLVPSAPGVYAVAEQVTATSDAADFGCQRMLAVFSVGQADDLARSLSRLFASESSLRERLLHSRCYLRYAVVSNATQRAELASALERWLHGDAHTDAAMAAAAVSAVAPVATGPAPGEEPPSMGFASTGKPPFPSGF